MRRPSPALLLAGAALIVALGGVAVAQGGGGEIFACSNNLRGTLRVVDAGVACEADETALSWNRQGPPGPQGQLGPAGQQGPAGPPGDVLLDSVGVGPVSHKLKVPPNDPKLREYPRVKVREQGKKKPKLKFSVGGEPTRIFSARRTQSMTFIDGDLGTIDGDIKTLARLVVLPGKYAVTAKAVLRGDLWNCTLSSTSGSKVNDSAQGVGLATLPLMLDVNTAKPAAIELRCQFDALKPNHAGLVFGAFIRAVNVASIHVP